LKSVITLIACLVLMCGVTPRINARQAAIATLSGIVADPNGAAIPAAQISATQKATNITRETTTNEEGLYVFTNLPVGEYEVRVKAQGFQAAAYGKVVLQVGQNTRTDFALQVMGVSATICIDCGMNLRPLINTESVTVDDVLTEREIGNLPLNGRNFLELALLVPGNAHAPNFDPT
jgi:hypothetical protein